ncbi:hypothetical protein ACHQM5_017031 [Ranunculus cassubicifolius]
MGIPNNSHPLHVAMVSSPGTGHYTASLELANHLISFHDVQVTFFVTNTTTTLSSHSPTTTSATPNLHLINLPPVDISEISPENTSILSQIGIILRLSLPAIRSSIANSSPQPTVLIVDEFSTDAFEIAESVSMKMYSLITMNATEFSFMAYLPAFDKEIKIDYRQLTEPLRVPGCKSVPVKYLSDSFQDRNSESYKCALQHAEKFGKASGILVNTFYELESHTIDSLNDESIGRQISIPRVHAVGPLINSLNRPSFDGKDDKRDDVYLTWLDKQPNNSVVYVSFGSGGTLTPEQLTELAHGLEMSQQRFIWVVRPPQTPHQDTSAGYFHSGNGSNEPEHYLPAGFLDRTKDIGLVIPKWAPQIEILGHDSVGGFLSHCGWNSTLESIVNGVPMIGFPLFAEQRLNAWMMSSDDVKVAVQSEMTPREGLVKREEIEKMVRLVMEKEEGKEMRNRAKEFKQSAIRSLEKGGSSYNTLSKLVENWKNA